jgi:hypothetical protein
MADKDDKPTGLTKAESELSKVTPPFEVPEDANPDYVNDPPDRIVPSKGDDGYDTPSGYALAKVGEFEGEPGSDEAKVHGLKYRLEKIKKRWGFGG